MRSKHTEKWVGAIIIIGIMSLIAYDVGLTRISAYFLPNLTDPLPPKMQAQYDKGWSALEDENYDTAYTFLLPLALRGYSKAQHNIGFIYSDGPTDKRDLIKAQEWYLKAAKQNHAKAMFNLGHLLLSGDLSQTYWLQGVCWLIQGANKKDESAVVFLDALFGLEGWDENLAKEATKLSEEGECSNIPLL
ncbi:MAG: hypothetical protein R3261_03475 [Alphaproteobacteria bacterium]|nr:hypothetical protein [Alphaproteobacteria bacterium]